MTKPAEALHNLPQAGSSFKVMAIYKFAMLDDCARLKSKLSRFCAEHGIKGTLILAPEGINGTIAGTDEAVDALADCLAHDAELAGRLEGAEIKYSRADSMPFLRMKVRLKPEIVTLRAPEANAAHRVGTYVDPQDWNALIDRNDVVLVDTRNDYEVGLGSFDRAIDPETRSFTEFKDYVARELNPQRDRKVAMFCTGGIRCEKASAYLLAHGFEEVFHLKGGILAYLEQVPADNSRWHGECFVFDERVTVGHGLEPGSASLCRACRHPLTETDRAAAQFVEGVSCPHCANAPRGRAGIAERTRQMALAEARGESHLGDSVAAEAERRRLAKKARRQADRERAAQLGKPALRTAAR